MPKLTALQACQQTHDLWTKIAQEAEKGHHKEKEEIPGPWQNYLDSCPCCERVKIGGRTLFKRRYCDLCPMKPEWLYFYNKNCIFNIPYNYFCCKCGPYLEWSSGRPLCGNLSCYDLAFFAYLIADLAFEAIERIKKEEETTP